MHKGADSGFRVCQFTALPALKFQSYPFQGQELEESVVSGVQTFQGSSITSVVDVHSNALQDEEMEEWVVTPEEFHQHSDSQAYADNVRPCAEMLFAALLEVHPVTTTTCLACDPAICSCGVQLFANCC